MELLGWNRARSGAALVRSLQALFPYSAGEVFCKRRTYAHDRERGPPLLEAFAHAAEVAPKDSTRIIFKNGVLNAEGGGKALFHRTSTRKAAIDALKKSVVEKYGEEFANIFAGIPGLKHVLKGSRSLRACHVRDLLQRVDEKVALPLPLLTRLQDMMRPPNKEGEAFDAIVLSRLKDLVQTQIRTLSAEDQDRLKNLGNSSEEKQKEIVEDVLQKLPCTLCLRAASGQIPHPDFHDMEMTHRAHGNAVGGKPALHTLDEATLASFAVDMEVDKTDARIAYGLMMHKLPDMRSAQPEGLLTAETVWKACFKEAGGASKPDARGSLVRAMSARMLENVTKALGSHAEGHMASLKNALSNGLSYDMVLKMAEAVDKGGQKPPLTSNSLSWSAPLESWPNALEPHAVQGSPEEKRATMETFLAGGLCRMEPHTPTFTFKGEKVSRACYPADTSMLNAEGRENYKAGNPSPKTHEIMEQLDVICKSDAQRITVCNCLRQGGLHAEQFGSLYGVRDAQPLSANAQITRPKECELVTVRLALPVTSKLEARVAYVVDAAGKYTLDFLNINEREEPTASVTLPRGALSMADMKASIDAMQCSNAYKQKLHKFVEEAGSRIGRWGYGFAIVNAMEPRYAEFLAAIPKAGGDVQEKCAELIPAWMKIYEDAEVCQKAVTEMEWLYDSGWGADDNGGVRLAMGYAFMGKNPAIVAALQEAGFTFEEVDKFANEELKRHPEDKTLTSRLEALLSLFDAYEAMTNAT